MDITAYILICAIGILSGRVEKRLPSLRSLILAAAASLSCLQTMLTYALTYGHLSDALGLFVLWGMSNLIGFRMSKATVREDDQTT